MLWPWELPAFFLTHTGLDGIISAVAGGNSSAGRAMAFQAVGRGFESRFPLHFFPAVFDGAVAQRESTSLARKGSGVQIASAPPRVHKASVT